MIMPTDRQRVEAFTGELVHVYASKHLADYQGMASGLKIEEYLSPVIQEMVLILRGYCASGHLPMRTETVTVEWPITWWQAFKQAYFPSWLIKKFPVQMQERLIECSVHHYFVCPHVKVPTHGNGMNYHIQFMATGTPLAERMSHDPRF